MSFTPPATAVVTLMAPLGFCLGVGYFAALRRTTELIAARGGALQAIAWTFGRGVAALGVLGFAAWLGAMPLLSAFAGFLFARSSALHRGRRAD